MFATGDERCPVKFLEKLISMRPPSLKQSGPLYWDHLRSPREMCGFQCSQWESTKSIPMWRNLRHWEDWSAQTRGSPTTVSVKQWCANFRKLVSLTTKSLQWPGIAMNRHWKTMPWLTCKTTSTLVASYPNHVLWLLLFSTEMLLNSRWGTPAHSTTLQTALCT